MFHKLLCIIYLCFIPFFQTIASPTSHENLIKEYNWVTRSSIDEATLESIQPYLLPSNHPAKPVLDAIFSSYRASASAETMQAVGFIELGKWKWDKAYVAKHPLIPNYLVKVYLDNHTLMSDKFLLHRIFGAEMIRATINSYGLQTFLKVPNKWIYPLPDSPPQAPGLPPKNFILVAEDMNLVSEKNNKKKYQECLDENRLLALFIVVNTLGLSDSIYLKNIPFSIDGKIAFVDTERYGFWPIRFHKLLPLLHPKMQTALERKIY